MTVADRNIVVGVCGSIAAYKSAFLVSGLVQKKANVTVVMTPAATKFVAPLTFSALCGKPVLTEIFSSDYDHLKLTAEADLFVIAPATANSIAKLAAGYADNLVTALALTKSCPLLVCPAMNEKMWQAPETQENLKKLKSKGCYVMEPQFGYLACGEEGRGRLAEPAEIVKEIETLFQKSNQLAGLTLLITTGATREYIDPVRFLSNPSSGLTGYYLAEEAARRGAQVHLVAGFTTVDLALPPNVVIHKVISGQEMRAKVKQLYPQVDSVIMAAAVSDFIPETSSGTKLKKEQVSSVKLKPAPDILKELGAEKENQVLVGFAAQTHDWISSGKAKLKEKNLNFIVVTDVSQSQGFGAEKIRSWLVFPDTQQELGLIAKKELATIIVDKLADITIRPL